MANYIFKVEIVSVLLHQSLLNSIDYEFGGSFLKANFI